MTGQTVVTLTGMVRQAKKTRGKSSRLFPCVVISLNDHLYVVSSRKAMGPRACNRWVEIATSAPKPSCDPSVNRVLALTYTAAESTGQQTPQHLTCLLLYPI